MNASHRALIAYYSLTGNTARVARDLSTRIDAAIESIQDPTHGVGGLGQFVAAFDAWRKAPAKIAALQHDPAHYAITIVGTPVWMWQMTPAVRAYLEQTRGRARSVAFFVTSGDTDVAKIRPSLEALAGHKATASAGFNANELRDAAVYETKLSTFVEEITRAGRSPRQAA